MAKINRLEGLFNIIGLLLFSFAYHIEQVTKLAKVVLIIVIIGSLILNIAFNLFITSNTCFALLKMSKVIITIMRTQINFEIMWQKTIKTKKEMSKCMMMIFRIN